MTCPVGPPRRGAQHLITTKDYPGVGGLFSYAHNPAPANVYECA